jgi:glyoxylase-like metal-dependent hydrolase (beta-lactamase superfamily II)
MPEISVTPLGHDLYLIDAYLLDQAESLACYLFDTPERVLIECGPSRSLPHLLAALEHLGVDDVATVAVTHIHLDHAGGAGQIAAHFPDARVAVHTRGARHLADPARLWESATRVYGPERMQAMWGPMQPVPPERLQVIDEGDRISLGGGRHIDVLYTPGHAKHHVVFLEAQTGGAFIGDAVGLAFPHGHIVQPNTPPPDFDPGLSAAQFHRLAALDPAFLGFAHYGLRRDPRAALAEAEDRMWAWVRFVEAGAGDDETLGRSLREWVLAGYREEGHPEEAIAEYDERAFWWMFVPGIRHWLEHRS